jgi:hypothetical protein
LQRNKHNEQQSLNHEILRNLGKTPMWGNPKRERDLFSFRKVHINSSYTISSKRRLTYSTHNLSQLSALENVHRNSVLLYGPALFQHFEICCAKQQLYGLICTALLQQEKPQKLL